MVCNGCLIAQRSSLAALLLTLGSLAEAQDIHFRINLAGYLPQDTKVAIVLADRPLKGAFHVLDGDGNKVIKGKVQPSAEPGYGTFRYYRLDFSGLTREGAYRLFLPTLKASSPVFLISPTCYRTYPDDLLAFMRQQRCGYNPFFDATCHQRDARTFYGPAGDSVYVDVTGGWHDAGDQLKYLITSSNAIARMLMAYQLYPGAFGDLFSDLGQPHQNEVPDVLDEARWGLDWILKLHPAPDQLVHQVGDDRDHVGWKKPEYDPSNYGWGKDSYRAAYFADGKPQGVGKFKSEATGVANLAGRSAAALALGYHVFKDLDSPYAQRCLKAARELYALGKSTEGYQQGNSHGAPYRYNEDTWTDDMEWGAAELFRATSDPVYLRDAQAYAERTATLSWIERDTSAHYQYYPFLNIAHYSLYDLVDKSVQSRLAAWYKSGIEKTLARSRSNPFNHGVPFIWCSNNLTVDLILQIILYERMTGDRQFHGYMTAMRDWLFGRNPWGVSMFTGIPRQGPYAKDVHTSTWALFKKEVPGGLVDGPIYATIYNKLIGLRLTKPDALAEFQNAYVVYHDDIGDYSTNEPTMDGTACAIMLMAAMAVNSFN